MKPLLILMFILGLIAGILGVLAARQAYAVQVTASVLPNKCNQCISLCQQKCVVNVK